MPLQTPGSIPNQDHFSQDIWLRRVNETRLRLVASLLLPPRLSPEKWPSPAPPKGFPGNKERRLETSCGVVPEVEEPYGLSHTQTLRVWHIYLLH